MKDDGFNPEMLTLAREARGYTQTRLAQSVSLTPSLISKFESGTAIPSTENLAKLAGELRYPLGFFAQSDQVHGLGCSFLYHRQRLSMPVPEQRRVIATVNILKMQIERLLRGIEINAHNSFEPRDAEQDGGPEKIARALRVAWMMPPGPVRSVTGAIESAGGLVIRYPFGNRKMDGLSLPLPGLPPLFFLNSDMPGDRARFTLAHELAHVIMHRQPTEGIEDEANSFASEFLMPAEEIKPDLAVMSLERAAALKAYWKVSMQAIIRRAYDLGVIPASRYRRLCTQVSMAGYRTHEPVEVPVEEPTLLSQVVATHLKEHHYTIDNLSEMTLTSVQEFCFNYVSDPASRLRIAR